MLIAAECSNLQLIPQIPYHKTKNPKNSYHKKGKLFHFIILIRHQNEKKVNVKTPETLLLGWNFNDRCSEMTLWRANERDRETTFTVSVLGEIEEMPPMEWDTGNEAKSDKNSGEIYRYNRIL